jgi:hypothetical protein
MEYLCEGQVDVLGESGQSCPCKTGLDVPAEYFTEQEKAGLLKDDTVALGKTPYLCHGTPKTTLGTTGESEIHCTLAEIISGVVARLKDGSTGTSVDSTTDDGASIPA